MIATMLPGLLGMGLYGLKSSYDCEGGILLAAFLLANFWMMAVVDSDMNRGVTVANALRR